MIFAPDGVFRLHAQFKPRLDDWIRAFPQLSRYRDKWPPQANRIANVAYAEPLRQASFLRDERHRYYRRASRRSRNSMA